MGRKACEQGPLLPSFESTDSISLQDDLISWLVDEAPPKHRNVEDLTFKVLFINFAALEATCVVRPTCDWTGKSLLTSGVVIGAGSWVLVPFSTLPCVQSTWPRYELRLNG